MNSQSINQPTSSFSSSQDSSVSSSSSSDLSFENQHQSDNKRHHEDTSKNNNRGSDDSSVDDILNSMRTLDYESRPRSSAILSSGFFEFGKPKAVSTNTSPLKRTKLKSIYRHPPTSSVIEKLLPGASPQSYAAVGPAKANGGVNDGKKSVRFNDWETHVPAEQRRRLMHFRKKKNGLFHRSRSTHDVPSKSKGFYNLEENDKVRVSSSDYGETPDVTQNLGQENDYPSLSEKQLRYILPDIIEPLGNDADAVNGDSHGDGGSNDTKDHHNPTAKESNKHHRSSVIETLKRDAPESAISDVTNSNSVFSNSGTSPLETFTSISEQRQQSDESVYDQTTLRKFSLNDLPNGFDADDTAMSLARRFNELSLKSPHQTLRTSANQKAFSLRLQKSNAAESSSNGTPEASYDHIDILDQQPPDLPEITTNSGPDDSFKTDLTIPLFDSLNEADNTKSREIQNTAVLKSMMKKMVITLSKAMDHGNLKESHFDELEMEEMLELGENLSNECSRKLSGLKVQLIKNTKVLKDQENLLLEKNHVEHQQKAKVHDLLIEVDNLKNECSRYENRVSSQARTISFERETNREMEEKLRGQSLLLNKVQQDADSKEMFIAQISSLVYRYKDELTGYNVLQSCFGAGGSQELELEMQLSRDVDSTTAANSVQISAGKSPHSRGSVYDTLKAILSQCLVWKEQSALNSSKNEELEKERSELSSKIQAVKQENLHLEELLRRSNHEHQENEIKLKDCEEAIQHSHAERERYQNLLKSLESSYSGLKVDLETSHLKLFETLERNKSLELQKDAVESKLKEQDQIIKDQIELLREAETQIETQNTQFRELDNTKTKVLKQRDQLQETLEANQIKLNQVNQELDTLQKTHRASDFKKDEELKEQKRELHRLKEVELLLSNELKDTRSKLSDKFTEVSLLEKRTQNISKNLQDAQESNRSLRSDILNSGATKQELKRTLTSLSVNLVREFQGIIDDVSLSTIRDGLQVNVSDGSNDEEKNLSQLSDAALFIQEAVSLVVKDYWALSTKYNNFQKNQSSVNALQRINDGQAMRLKKLESKLQYYETLFRKIHNANERPGTIHGGQRSAQQQSQPQPPSTDQESSDQESLSSVVTSHEKRQEIKKLLSKVSKPTPNLDY